MRINLHRRLAALEKDLSSVEPIVLLMADGHTETVPGHNDYVLNLLGRAVGGDRTPEMELIARSVSSREPDGAHMEAIMHVSVEADLLKTLPCVGKILSMVFMLEIGRVDRFPKASHLASYAGLVPRVHSSGGHTRMGQVCGNVNRNLKWAFVETGNLIVINQRRLAGTEGGATPGRGGGKYRSGGRAAAAKCRSIMIEFA